MLFVHEALIVMESDIFNFEYSGVRLSINHEFIPSTLIFEPVSSYGFSFVFHQLLSAVIISPPLK